MEINVTNEELISVMKVDVRNTVVDAMDQMIRYLRQRQKEYQAGSESVSGVTLLNEILMRGAISMSLYLKIRETLDNLDAPYEIILA